MDIDSFFTSPRWKVLEILAKTPSSPMEISKQLNTSIAYISQQLKLLEAAGLVTKVRTRATERGKPRTLF
jgi:DNA-binding MarR family transcriptional regulator